MPLARKTPAPLELGNPFPIKLKYEGQPLAARVIYGKGKMFRTKDYRAYVEALQWLLKEKVMGHGPWTGKFALRIIVHSAQRGDADNFIKPIMDAGTGIIWRNDSQVSQLYMERFNNGCSVEMEINRL